MTFRSRWMILYALTILAGAFDGWSYYLVGSALEVAALAAVAVNAWRWPALAPGAGTTAAP